MPLLSEKRADFAKRAEQIKQELQALLKEFRESLGEDESDNLVYAESDLYDAVDCLSDFITGCETPDKKA
jgi:ElaB/YqjD/DUF883 family membrane-anchored ribosome-binding protein